MIQRYLALQKVVELRSFSKAADALGYTQSSVSEMIASLEKEFSMRLLNRSRNGATLTHEGEELYPFIEQSIYQYNATQEKAKEINCLDTGIIRIGVMESISTQWMPQLLKRFKEIYPHVQVIMHQGDYAIIGEWIRTGAVDFGFVNPGAATGMKTIQLKQGLMPAIVPANHPLAKLEEIPLSNLEKEPFILLEEGLYYEPLEKFREEKITPNIEYTIHDDYTIMAMVEAGLGVSIIAELILHRTNYNIAIRPTDPPIYRTLGIGYRDWFRLPIASKRFIEFIKENISDLP